VTTFDVKGVGLSRSVEGVCACAMLRLATASSMIVVAA
jgi:hypothetical protein